MRAARDPGPLRDTSQGTGVLSRLPGRRLMKGPWMAAPHRKLRLSGEARRALELLVDQHGTTESLMLAHGFTDRMLSRLVRARLITMQHEVIKVGAKPIEVVRMMITD